jgi:hypothetical protein
VGALPFTRTVRCAVRAAGDLLSYRRFASGSFELASDAERASLMTTMLTDVAMALWARCQELDGSAGFDQLLLDGCAAARRNARPRR